MLGHDHSDKTCAVAYTSPMSRDKRLQDRSIYPHWCSDTVRFCDQDAAGHVNNVAICAYMETARLTFMRDMGMMAPREDGVRGISAGMTISFLAESHWPGRIELGTGVLRVGTSSITVGSAAFKDEVCIAAAEMTVVRLQGTTPHPIDPALRTALDKYRLKGRPAE
jgi:acyl-CoA thioester hydrolase